jgi:hypothetical protein
MNSNFIALRIDSSGNLLWSKEYGGPGPTYIFSLNQISNGNFVATGSYTYSGNELLIFSIDQSGDTVFSNTLGRNGVNEQGKSIVESGNGNLFITGSEMYDSTSDFNIFFAKTDAQGKTGCNEKPALISMLGTINLQVSSFQPAITAGTTTITDVQMTVGSGISEAWICSSIGIQEIKFPPDLNISPNPSGGIFHISFSEKNPYRKMVIFNSMGKIILQIDVRGEETIDVDLSHQVPGIYLARLENENQFQITRICLMK